MEQPCRSARELSPGDKLPRAPAPSPAPPSSSVMNTLFKQVGIVADKFGDIERLIPAEFQPVDAKNTLSASASTSTSKSQPPSSVPKKVPLRSPESFELLFQHLQSQFARTLSDASRNAQQRRKDAAHKELYERKKLEQLLRMEKVKAKKEKELYTRAEEPRSAATPGSYTKDRVVDLEALMPLPSPLRFPKSRERTPMRSESRETDTSHPVNRGRAPSWATYYIGRYANHSPSRPVSPHGQLASSPSSVRGSPAPTTAGLHHELQQQVLHGIPNMALGDRGRFPAIQSDGAQCQARVSNERTMNVDAERTTPIDGDRKDIRDCFGE